MIDYLDLTHIRGIHKFVPIPDAEDHLRVGWMAVLTGEPHPVMVNYRVHMVWCCKCEMVIPWRVAA
jgi:hypothetical protein